MTRFVRSTNKPHFGPIIEWSGGPCPVAPGVAVSVMCRYEAEKGRGYWTPLARPESANWQHTGAGHDILAYYERALAPKPPKFGETCHGFSIPFPQSLAQAEAMAAVARVWIDRHFRPA